MKALMSIEELIANLRGLHQLSLYTVNEDWCIQLYELDVCANDHDVFKQAKYAPIYESSNHSLQFLLIEATEWAAKRYQDC
ncbi:hypothetical protein [Paenibacillus pinihumi]|uniref:hypothetical protein n=1 Tax=Paenibacillus pinihumi TaxID=669462 RepID=UPI00040ED445|nr:hypothetical protein [Paenibacillus pinihumi]